PSGKISRPRSGHQRQDDLELLTPRADPRESAIIYGMFRIGSIELDRPVALAPMEDVSYIPFRALCKAQGADLVYTESTNCESIVLEFKRAIAKIRVTDTERTVAIQLYGSNGESLEHAAEIAEQAGPDFIDINCGCWVKKVANRGDGAGLLK